MNFFRGIKKLFTSKYCRYGLVIPIALMFFIVFNKPFVKNNPATSWLIFYGSTPVYIYCIGYQKNKKSCYMKPDPRVEEIENQTYQTKQVNYKELDCVSENPNVEKIIRTTTEEIIFNGKGRYYRN